VNDYSCIEGLNPFLALSTFLTLILISEFNLLVYSACGTLNCNSKALRKWLNKNSVYSVFYTSLSSYSSKAFSSSSSIAWFRSFYHLYWKWSSISCLISTYRGIPSLKYYMIPKNLDRLSPSSKSASRIMSSYKMSLKTPIIWEKTTTPQNRIIAPTKRSTSLNGYKSPNPTVDNDVNEK